MTLVLVGLAGGCGGGNEASPATSGVPVAELLAQAPKRLREQGTFRFSFHYTRTRADRPDAPERYSEGDGAVDLASGEGRMTLEFELGLPKTPAPLDGPIELRWNRKTLTLLDDGKNYEVDRDRGRLTGGLLGRMPDEPTGLIDLLESAVKVRDRGSEEIADVDVRRIEFVVPARVAGKAGVPPELYVAAQTGGLGAELPLEAWIDDDGLLRRVAYEVRLAALRHRTSGRPILPRRTIRGVYDFSEFGRPL